MVQNKGGNFMANENIDKQWFVTCIKNASLVEKIKKITMIMTDVDGCLTDCIVNVNDDGNEHKAFSVQDGFGITRAMKAGLTIVLVSGRDSQNTRIRAQKLGIPEKDCYVGGELCKEKGSTITTIIQEHNVTPDQTIFFGDDVLDIEVKKHVGLFFAPANAIFYVRHHADHVIPLAGGKGAFRLLLDLIMYVQKKHPAQNLIEQTIHNA
jgi:3-deoxy-D-manno-octulosonate 8-phosphate phosphatase (KDO 8-P phosphatase)